jgi:CRISPR/Cas system-associated exonuclease Cas4 (RecB family)
MPLPRGYISHSQIRTYNECPRKYYFAYVEGIRPPVNEKVFLGEVFHATIERYFLEKINGSPPADKAVADIFQAIFDDAGAGREIVWQAPRRETRERGLAFLKHFLRHIAPTTRPLMVEKELSLVLPGCGVRLKGVIDLVEEDYCITDFKTATSKWSAGKARNSWQMIIYKYLFDGSFGPVGTSLKYEVLYGKSAGHIRHQTLRIDPPEDAVASLLLLIRQVADRIERQEFPANESPGCRYCEFRSPCEKLGNV